MDERELDAQQESPENQGLLAEPRTRFVNYRWLNVRQKPSLASPVIEKIYENDSVQVKGYPTDSWAFISTQNGTDGYVARRYLKDEQQTIAAVPNTPSQPEVTEPVETAPVEEPVVEEPVVEEPVVEEPAETTPVESPTEGAEQQTFDIPVITYHHILDDTDNYPASMVLPEVNLFAQLDYLVANGFETYTFADLKAIKEGRKTAAANAVILSFNGGYADAYIAAQHLNGKGMKGVFFVSTEKIGEEGFLDWRQVKKMHSWGMEIGSLGVTGANLASSGEFYINDEVTRSKQILEEELGDEILVFAYANGAYNNQVVEAVREAGYEFARTIDEGSRYTTEQLLTIPTLRVFFPAGARQFQAWLGQ